MNTRVEPCPTAATVSAYERLRSHCLEARPRVAGALGLSVLLRYGMLAWAHACVPARQAKRPPAAVRLETARAPAPLHEDIIDVMVSMTMSCSRSAHSGARPA
jgi:hypothetical protein